MSDAGKGVNVPTSLEAYREGWERVWGFRPQVWDTPRGGLCGMISYRRRNYPDEPPEEAADAITEEFKKRSPRNE